MAFNECPDVYFEPCPGESNTDFNEGKGVFWVTVIESRGKSIANHGVKEDVSPLLGDFPCINYVSRGN